MTLQADIRSLAPGSTVELFELDATALGGTITRMTSNTNQLRGSVVWQGNTYQPFPIEAEGFAFTGQGQLPRPKVRVANITGAMSALVLAYGDLLGAKFTRKRTLVKFLDAVNFPDRVNYLKSTDALDAWTVSAATVTTNFARNRLGDLIMDKVVDTTAAAVQHYVQTVSDTGIVIGEVWTLSCDLRPMTTGSKRFLSLHVRGAGAYGAIVGAVFDPVLGIATTVSGGCTAAITDNGDGSYRCAVTLPAATATGAATVRAAVCNAGTSVTLSNTGDGVSGLIMGGFQLEKGAAFTRYQPIGAAWSRNPNADPTAAFPDDVFFIDRKSGENNVVVEFELSAAFDVAGVLLPRGVVVQNVCPWRYRVADPSSGCTWTGTTYFDALDNPVPLVGQDVCGKRLSSCQIRHGVAELPFGGMPAAGLIR